MDDISSTYESSNLPSPLGVRAHFTRSMAGSKAFFSGVSLLDIYNASGWSLPLTFLSRMKLVILSANGEKLTWKSLELRGKTVCPAIDRL